LWLVIARSASDEAIHKPGLDCFASLAMTRRLPTPRNSRIAGAMLGLDFIKSNREAVAKAISDKGVTLDLDALLSLDSEVRSLKTEIEGLRAERNAISARFKDSSPDEKAELGRKAKEAGARAGELEQRLSERQEAMTALLLQVPNIPYEGAPVGPDESANVVVRREGAPPSFDFEPIDHVALIERNDWADLSRITHVAGSRTYCLKGRLALLEQKMMAWALERIADSGFTPITVPALAREQAFLSQGQFPGHRDETYQLPNDDLYLAGTAEVALTSLHSGEIIEGDRLPILYAGYSPCFRREAGSAGKDVRGLLRVHQFVKVEQYVICEADEGQSAQWHGRLLELAESLLQALEIPYQVIETSTGDMGLGKYRMNDIESWVPSLAKYRETHSCSTLHDWQARRANLRYRGSDGKVRFAHTLNNTALASPRILVPLLENHQTGDGRVRLPEALQELMGGEFL
ncbi:MAG TPA: serine--tRNA ligase, partial [Sphingomicrobium sp.]|nr:serine--tRNA ligase [Sphingomicrobium sp.]